MALFSGHRYDAARAALPDDLRAALDAAGLARAGVLARAFDGQPAEAVKLARELLPRAGPQELADSGIELQLLRDVALPEAESARRRFANLDPSEVMVGYLEGLVAKRRRLEEGGVAAAIREADAAWRPAVRPGRFRLKGDARLAAASGPTARADAEAVERARWRDALVDLVVEAGGPIVEATAGTAEPRKALAAAAGGRRARTLAKRVRAWKRLREWCVQVYGRPYPARPVELVEYLQARADEPCGLSALQAVAELYAFAESCRGVPQGLRLVDDPYYIAFQRELSATHARPEGKGAHQAPRLPLGFMVALEREVVVGQGPAYYRAYAWWQLLAAWGTLRFDDHRGLAPSGITLRNGRFVGTLSRTKTTGPGKKVLTLPVVVSGEAYVAYADWLAVGWGLWERLAPYVRDYLLARPTVDLEGVAPVELSYTESAWLLRGLLAGLPRFGESLLGSVEPLIPLFTQHSGRCWLSSQAALLGISEHRLTYLGRWSPSTAKIYVRTAAEVIAGVQEEVAGRLRRDIAAGEDPLLGEEQAGRAVCDELGKRGLSPVQVDAVIGSLDAWTRELLPGLGQGAPRTPPADVDPSLLPRAPLPLSDEDLPSMDVPEAEEPDMDSWIAGMWDAIEQAAPAPEVLAEEEAPALEEEPAPLEVPGGLVPPVLPEEFPEEEKIPELGFVVSVAKSGWRRLHRLGGCARHPGVHYLNFELLGLDRPDVSQYDDFCRQCWRGSDPQEPSDEEDSDSEEDDEEDCAPAAAAEETLNDDKELER